MEQIKEEFDLALSDREIEVLTLTSKGFNRKQISEALHISHHTVDFHLRNVLNKFNTKKSVVAVVEAIKNGVISI